MHLTRPLVAATVVLSAIAAASASHARSAPDPARAAEVARIRVHFDSVLADLPARSTAGLTAEHRARRAAVMETLRAYRDRGDFPHNYDFSGQAVPYFVDRETGVRCAVAHLLESTGRRDIVDRVAATDNNVWVPSLAADTAFAGWLRASGLTLDEAAFIQVPYVGDGQVSVATQRRVNEAFAAATASTAALGAWNVLGNAKGQHRIVSALGVVSGLATAGFGTAGMRTGSSSPEFGVAAIAVGGVTTFLSTRGVIRHRRIVAAEKKATGQRVSVAPIVVPGRAEVGASATIRF